jgi:hypothetical protein
LKIAYFAAGTWIGHDEKFWQNKKPRETGYCNDLKTLLFPPNI